MAKRGKRGTSSGENAMKMSKAALIRQAAKDLGASFRPRDIVAALDMKGIKVGYTQIAKALRAGGFRKRGGRKAGMANAATNGVADSTKVNKAQRIRYAAKKLGKKVRPKDIIAELAKDGITVSSAQVSTTLRDAGYRRRRRRAVAAVGAGNRSDRRSVSHGLDLEALIATKALVDKIGGIETAEEALRALKRLG